MRSGSQVKLANMKLKEFLVSAVNTLRSHILPATLAMIDNTLKEPFFHTRYSLKERMVNVRQRGLLEVQKGPISVIYTPSGNVKEIYNDCELVAKDVCHLLNGLSLDTQHPTDAVLFALF